MKYSFVLLFALVVNLLSAQSVDSVAIKQVDSLIKVSRSLAGKSDFDKALEVNAAAEKIALEKLGKDSPAYGDCCFNHGRILKLKRDYPGTEKWYLEAKAIREKALGLDHPNYANSLNSLAILYKDMGQYEKAEPLYQESKAIREKVLGKEHPDYAQSLNNLGNLYSDRGQYEKAELLYLESIAIREKVLGKEHPDYAQSLNNLGSLYSFMGQYEKAEPLYLEAKVTRERVLGKEHPDFVTSLSNLASHYFQISQYDKAEPLYLEARDICEKVLGKEHPDYAQRLGNLASIYRKLGQYEKAELLFLESKTIFEKALGKEHPIYAQSLNLLAILYDDMSQYEKAEPLYLEAKAIQEKALGKEHPNYASSLNNLGILYGKMGQYEKSELLLLESKAIWEKDLGKEHSEIAKSLNNLAMLYWIMGQSDKVESLYLESKAIYEKALGKEHPDYVASQHNLAILYFSMHRYEKAEPIFLELSTVNKLLIERALRHLSEKELINYLNLFSISQSEILSFVHISNSQKAVTASFDNTLFYKGFLLNAASKVKRLALSDATFTEKYNKLKSYEHRLATEYSKPITERRGVEELEEKSNALEKDLARTVAAFGEAVRQVNWQEIQQVLKPDEAVIEFVHYRYYDKKQTDSVMYAALLLRPGSNQPQFIPLFEEKQLDSLLQSSGDRKADYVNSLYTLTDRGAAPIGGPQRSLYELIWKPLKKELQEVQTIYFSPAGQLHRLNLGAIPISEEQTVADRFRLVEMGSTRQLVIPSNVNPGLNDALLFGGIQYEADSAFLAQAKQTATTGDLASRGGPGFANADSTLRGGNWNYLKWTDKEVTGLYSILNGHEFQTTLRRGLSATEEEFKIIGQGKPSPRILHLATHGFFFPDPKQTASVRIGLGESEPVFKMSDHPMIRSGLILAGGNHAWKYGKPVQEGMEDGILTAYEISQMNLSNTELVVLSACETGLGDIQGNEGVYGLQRAFKIAGAKYLIMSLWQVPDQETSVFMTTFYKNWLDYKMSIPDAFRKTQQEMRDRFINPYQWAGFVLVE